MQSGIKLKAITQPFHLKDMPNCLELPGGKIYSTFLPHGRFEVLGLVFEDGETGSRLAYYTDCKSIPLTRLS